MKRIENVISASGAGFLVLLIMVAVSVQADDCLLSRDDAQPYLSSAHLHQRREGVILPLLPPTFRLQMNAVRLKAEPEFFACHVRNLSVRVNAEFDIQLSNTAAAVPLAFPITPHVLYGDHNRLNDVRITVNDVPVVYRAAMDYDLWKIAEDGLYYKGRRVNSLVHPLFENALDLRSIAPQLACRGHDLALFWHVPQTTAATVRIGVEYTAASNDFSSCCKEVRDCALSGEPLYFYFDLSNANAWGGEKTVDFEFSDSARAMWSGVPKTGLQTTVTNQGFSLSGRGSTFRDLCIPVQPALFSCQPRTWFLNPSPVQQFTLRWNKGFAQTGIDSVVVDAIEGFGGIAVTAALPIRLSPENPQATFTAAYELPIMPPAYVDITGTGYRGSAADTLYAGRLHISLAGETITGHDLEIRAVNVQRQSLTQYRVSADIYNAGCFTEPLTMTVNVNKQFVRAERFRSVIAPGEIVTLTLPVEGDWMLPAEFEVEIEPSPGEVKRHNNALAVTYPDTPLPRRENFTLRPDRSVVTWIAPYGKTLESPLYGGLKLFLGDPDVPVIALAGMTGLSIEGAVLYAPDIDLPTPGTLNRPPWGLYMFKDSDRPSIGSFNYLTGEIHFVLFLKTRQGEMPAKQPMHFSGILTPEGLHIRGHSAEPSAVPRMMMEIVAHRCPPPVKPEFWFSTVTGFQPSRMLPDSEGNFVQVSDGDLLSSRGYIVAKNHALTKRLGIMPIVPDLGLTAVTPGPRGEIWFSFDKKIGRIWSETLGCYLQHGDLLSNTGRIVQTNQQLVARFKPMLAVNRDFGLDALALADTGAIYFSTTEDFFSAALNTPIGRGDLLSNRGYIVKTNRELLSKFNPMEDLADFGLDAVIVKPDGELWFSVESGFTDAVLGPVSDGDILSSNGYIVARNRQLLDKFRPVEQTDNFGLDALAIGFVDIKRWNYFPAGFGGDIDGDGIIDLRDFGILAKGWGYNYDLIDLLDLAQRWLE